jgi:hypothetical protein
MKSFFTLTNWSHTLFSSRIAYYMIFLPFISHCFLFHLERKNMDVNDHESLFNITFRHKCRQRNRNFQIYVYGVKLCTSTYIILLTYMYGVQHYEIKFVSDLRQVGGSLRVLPFPPPIKLTVMIQNIYLFSVTYVNLSRFIQILFVSVLLIFKFNTWDILYHGLLRSNIVCGHKIISNQNINLQAIKQNTCINIYFIVV